MPAFPNRLETATPVVSFSVYLPGYAHLWRINRCYGILALCRHVRKLFYPMFFIVSIWKTTHNMGFS